MEEPLPEPLPEALPIPPLAAAAPALEYESAQLAPGKGGLIAMSVLFFLIGAMTGCGTLSLPFLMMRTGGGPGPDVSMVIMILLVYGVMATVSIWTGVGCCRARRWVRPVALAVAWPWLLIGCIMFIFAIVSLIEVQGGIARAGGAPGVSLPTMILIIPALMMGVFFVGIPALLVWFFQRRKTAQTLWYYDPTPGWADRCPIPVLAWSLWTGFGAICLLGALTHRSIPVFGFIITGAPAGGVIVSIAAVLLCSAIGGYLLKPWAWWLAFAHTLILSASWLTFLLRGRVADYLVQTSPTTSPSAQELAMFNNPWFQVISALTGLLWIGFIFYLRRYFWPAVDSSLPAGGLAVATLAAEEPDQNKTV